MFKCPRCGFSENQKSSVLRHLQKKKECETKNSSTSRNDCITIVKNGDYKLFSELLLEEIQKLKQINVLQEMELKMKNMEETIEKLKEENNELKLNQIHVTEEQSECIYLLLEREFIHNPLKIAKIGRSVCFKNRMKQYPKGSKLLCVNKCNDSVKAETDLLILFNMMFKHRSDVGDEYFEGETSQMIKQINGYFYNNT
jgi:hypothetical protein